MGNPVSFCSLGRSAPTFSPVLLSQPSARLGFAGVAMTGSADSKQRSQLPHALRIIAADDEPLFLECLQKILQRLGHQVFPVANGRQLVEACRTIKPDLVIADVK